MFKVAPNLLFHDITYTIHSTGASYLQGHKTVCYHRQIDFLHLHGKAFRKRRRKFFHLLFKPEIRRLEMDIGLEIDLYGRLTAVDLRAYLIHPSDRADRPLDRNDDLGFDIRRIHLLLRLNGDEQHR